MVDKQDNEVGVAQKMAAHINGSLHRAFSIFIFNSKGELLLQQRANSKYHSPELWTNTCCSHPYPGETLEAATSRRLKEEMGFSCELHKAFHFIYNADVGGGLTEHEFDHVFIGYYDEAPKINEGEVMAWKWMSRDLIRKELESQPEKYTVWFRIAFKEVEVFLNR